MYLAELGKRILAIKSVKGSYYNTIKYNFKYLPREQAKYLPLVIGKKTIIKGNGRIIISKEIGMPVTKMKIGLPALNWAGDWETVLSIDGDLFINDREFFVGSGSSIEVSKNANLICGNKFNLTGKATIICRNKISFSNNALISWNTLIMDTDAHTIVSENGAKNINRPIMFGENTWIGANASVLSGTTISNNTVIGCGSVVKGFFEEENTVVAGNPAKVVKRGIEWSIETPANE